MTGVRVIARKLARCEIDLLKHLAKFSPLGFPVVVPRKFREALSPLWRIGLIDIWYRQANDADGSRATQFVSISVDGRRRIEAILEGGRKSRRLAGSLGQQEDDSDQSSEPQ